MRAKVVNDTFDILTDSETEDKLKLTAAGLLIKVDLLNLKDKELKIKQQPKHVIHTNLTMEELQERVKELQSELSINEPQKALEAMKEEYND